MTQPRIPGFRLGAYVFKDAEVVDFAAPHGVLSVARRLDPEIDAFLIADAARPVQAQAGFTVLGFHLLRRAGYDERFVSEVARVMEYPRAYELYRGDLEIAAEAAPGGVERT